VDHFTYDPPLLLALHDMRKAPTCKYAEFYVAVKPSNCEFGEIFGRISYNHYH